MIVSKRNSSRIGDLRIKQVQECKYLGNILTEVVTKSEDALE